VKDNLKEAHDELIFTKLVKKNRGSTLFTLAHDSQHALKMQAESKSFPYGGSTGL
jgi:hypothetical protein